MFRVVAPYQHKAPTGVHGSDLDDGQPPFGVPSLCAKGRRDPDRPHAEAAQQVRQQSDEAKNEKQRQKKSDVFKIHDSTTPPPDTMPTSAEEVHRRTQAQAYVPDRPAAATCSSEPVLAWISPILFFTSSENVLNSVSNSIS